MVLMCIVFNPKQTAAAADTADYSAGQLLLSNMGVAAQKCNLVGYQVILNKAGNKAVDEVKIPSRVYVELDFVGGTQLHVATSAHPNDPTKYEHIHAIPLALKSELNTIIMGMNPISFNIGQRINKHINIRVKRMDDDSTSDTFGKLIPIKTDSSAYLQTQASSETSLHSVVLYFDYPFVSLF